MIQVGTRLNAADNSGAKQVLCINIPGSSRKVYAHLGDVITTVVKGASPTGQVKDGQIGKGLIVRTRKEKRRADGSYIRFDDNAAVLIDEQGNPVGTRVTGPIAREIKDLGFNKIASLAKEVL